MLWKRERERERRCRRGKFSKNETLLLPGGAFYEFVFIYVQHVQFIWDKIAFLYFVWKMCQGTDVHVSVPEQCFYTLRE